MRADVDEQTRTIVQFLMERHPDYVRQIQWASNPLVRILDFLLLGAIGRFFLQRGRRASSPQSIGLFTKAISVTFSKKVMATALFYRGNYLFEGAADADRSIADYSLAIWCNPSDCWARKDRATIYEMYRASYGKGDENFALPMTHRRACEDAEAALAFFRSLAGTHPSDEGQEHASRMAKHCEELLRKLRDHTLREYKLDRTAVEAMADFQAGALGTSIEDEAARYISHHIGQEIGWMGGRIDFALKMDILVKTYPCELAACIFLRLPDSAKQRGLDLVKRMDRQWSKGSVGQAADVAACLLTLMGPAEAGHLIEDMTEGTKTLVKQSIGRISTEHAGETGKGETAPTEPGMVLVQAGEFLMGTSREQVDRIIRSLGNWQRSWFEREMPQRNVYLDTYWIDKYPVTNAAYKDFVDATGHPIPFQRAPLARPLNWDPKTKMYPKGKEDHPVVLVDWRDACAYAEWAGKRLPTEAEWEKAARGADGRIWTWGNSWDPTLCNHGMGRSRGTTPVTAYERAASPYGVVDMAGNVWEWCADGFDMRYHSKTASRNPKGSGNNKVIRGGCWYDEQPELYRCAVRDGTRPDHWEFYRGFRCARNA